ncbi:calcium-binding protein [Roseovarius sp. D22-M7]|uniref:calcium-binding protein n=1 Tax=Roseovarius sp. D22-M7 TaxID=3127116 RepID=UPI00300FCAE3
MKTRAKLAAATAILMSLGGAALAAGDHGHGGQGAPGSQGPGAGNHDMMQMMMRMHAQMMGGSEPMGRMGMMGAGGPMSDMAMMGGGASFMGLAMERFEADGTPTPQEAHERLQALLAEYDIDGDKALSLAEFETLHSALIRETMVDRFQFLDDDGDGAVTVEEVVKPADMMERMETMRDGMMPGPNGGMQGNGSMMGTPGQGRMGND